MSALVAVNHGADLTAHQRLPVHGLVRGLRRRPDRAERVRTVVAASALTSTDSNKSGNRKDGSHNLTASFGCAAFSSPNGGI
jgi:hypothetical protein